MVFGFVPVETFNNSHGDNWEKYISWSKLYKLNEVISLDCSLCPLVINKIEQKYKTIVSYDYGCCKIFNNLEWVLKRTENIKDKQVLAVLRNPTKESENKLNLKNFYFCGYDLIDEDSGISTLLNCRGFDKAFTADDLSTSGLIYDYQRAIKIQKSLIEYYPDDEHAYCTLWAIWKMKISTGTGYQSY